WKGFIKAATYAYNFSYHRAIQCTPLKLKYGRDVYIDQTGSIFEKSNALTNLGTECKRLKTQYTEKDIIKGKRKDKRSFRIRDEVLIYLDNREDKISSNWKDGYYIQDKLSDSSYLVTNGTQTYRLNKAYIKKNWIGSPYGGDVVIT
ncbi:hypothetical protein COBT_002104, partial [Conglomerata obtusa]